MHTETERKFILWAEFCRMLVMLEASAIDRPGHPNFVVDKFARETARSVGQDFIGDWIRTQPAWKGGLEFPKWVNTNIRTAEEVSDAIQAASLKWLIGDCDPLIKFVDAVDPKTGRQYVTDRFGVHEQIPIARRSF